MHRRMILVTLSFFCLGSLLAQIGRGRREKGNEMDKQREQQVVGKKRVTSKEKRTKGPQPHALAHGVSDP